MYIEYSQPQSFQSQNSRFWQSPKAFALLIGLILSLGFSFFLPVFTGFLALAPWLLGFALGCVGIALFTARRKGETLWGMAILGQLLGVLGIGLLFFALFV